MNARLLARGVAALTVTAGLGMAGSMAVDASTTPSTSPTASPSPASHPVTLGTLKEHCNVAVQRRLATLGADATFVKNSEALSSGDRATLEAQISADQQGLTALDKTIQSDTTYHQAWSDCQTDRHRVPRVRARGSQDSRGHCRGRREQGRRNVRNPHPRAAVPDQQLVGVCNGEGARRRRISMI